VDGRVDVFVGFSPIFLLGILIFKGLTARRLYKSFGVKELTVWLSNKQFHVRVHFGPSFFGQKKNVV
jgi:hypothetical protein